VGGVAIHAAATVVARHRAKKAEPESLPLAVLGETESKSDQEKEKE